MLYAKVINKPEVTLNIPRPKKDKRLPDVLSKKEVGKILNAHSNIKHRAILCMAYSAGLRVSEVVRLRIEDIDSERMLIHVRQGKGRKDRYSLLAQVALKELRNYVRAFKPEKWLFPGSDNENHITERTVQRIFESASEKCGIKKDVSIHTLRHYVES